MFLHQQGGSTMPAVELIIRRILIADNAFAAIRILEWIRQFLIVSTRTNTACPVSLMAFA